jgi:hypothetical protein
MRRYSKTLLRKGWGKRTDPAPDEARAGGGGEPLESREVQALLFDEETVHGTSSASKASTSSRKRDSGTKPS